MQVFCVLFEGEDHFGLQTQLSETGDYYEVVAVTKGGAADRAGICAGMWALSYKSHPCGIFINNELSPTAAT